MQKTLQVLNIIGFAVVIALNAMANALPINGYTTGELSDLYPNLFTPAGFTFGIWGLIYLGLLAFIVFQSRGLFSSKKPTQAVSLIGLWFFISCVANAGWILAWHYQIVWLSVIIMLVILISLITIYKNLGLGIREVTAVEKYTVHAPFSIYLGWISVATIANITTFLVDVQFGGLGLPQPFYTASVLIVATLVGLYILNRNLDVFYTAVLLWAFYGIFYKRYFLDENPYPLIITTLAASGMVLVFKYFKGQKDPNQVKAYL